MKGGIAAMMNQRTNELPLMRPITPPASPKNRQMIANAMNGGGPPSEQRTGGPEDRHKSDHDPDEPRDARHDPDDDLQQEPGCQREDERRDDAHHERRSGLLFHGTYCTPPAGRAPPLGARAQTLPARNRAATSRGAARPASCVR